MSEPGIFREISVGGLTKEALIQRLVEAGIQFNEYAKLLFEHRSFSPSQQTERIRLVKVSLSDLRLSIQCSFQAVLDRASGLGLQACPLHLGAFLRLEDLDQPEGPYLTIASPRPESDESYPTGFYIRNFEGAFWLRGYRVVGEAEWPAENEFVFRK